MHDHNKVNKTETFFPAGRLFIFIDETGDPGHPDNTSASRYFQLNFTIIHADAIEQLQKHFAAFRYFKDAGKELKKYTRDAQKIAEIFKYLSEKHKVTFLSFILHKEKYTGPYLRQIGKENFAYDPKKFRNFVLRCSLEYVFSNIVLVNSAKHNIELVFDRYLDAEDDELNLRKYLRNNYKLPHFEQIVQVDSRYSEAMQVSDFVGRFVKEVCFDDCKKDVNVFSFIRIFVLEDPDHINEKRPDTP